MEPSHFKDEGKRLGEFQKYFFFFGCSNLGLTETRKVQGFVFTMRLMVFGGYSKKNKAPLVLFFVIDGEVFASFIFYLKE
jgi:hypothetical protein